MYDLLIQGSAVLQLNGNRAHILFDHDIAIEQGRIAAIAPQISAGLARETLPMHGMLAFPGLINTHAHVAMALFRGVVEDTPLTDWFNQHIWPMELNLTGEDVYWGTLLGLAEMIESGITCVADHYFAMGEVARAVEQAGMRGLLSWTVFGGTEVEAQLQHTDKFVEQWHGAAGGRIRTWLGPHAPYTCPPGFLKLIAQQAQHLGVGIHIHLAETQAQLQQSLAQHRLTPVAVVHECGLFDVPAIAAHVAHLGPGDLDVLRANGVGVACCPKTSLKLGEGVTPVATLRQAGVPVGLGTDGAASNNTYDILEAARLLALFQKHEHRDAQVLPVGAALSLATSEGAQVLGLAGITGELRVGLQADIACLRLDALHLFPPHNLATHLLYSARTSDIDTVIVAGRVLMRGRQLLTIDRVRVQQEVSARMERLVQRQPDQRIQTYTVTGEV